MSKPYFTITPRYVDGIPVKERRERGRALYAQLKQHPAYRTRYATKAEADKAHAAMGIKGTAVYETLDLDVFI